MNRYSFLIGFSAFSFFFTRAVLAACLCGPGVPCDLFLSGSITEDNDYIACERVFLEPGFYVTPSVDVRIEAGQEISFDVETGADQGGILSANIVPALACEGDADFDEFNQCMDCDDTNGNVYPGALDVCDALDNDCDPASPDGSEDPQNGAACDGGDSDLCLEGALSCSAGALACSDNTGSNFDVCDGIDNDCDPSSLDGSEDPSVGTACNTGQQGVCAEGVTSCTAAILVCQQTIFPSAEICGDGLDNDCDGEIDNGCELLAEECLIEGDEDEDGAADCDDGDCVTIFQFDRTQCTGEASLLCTFMCLVDPLQGCADCLNTETGPQKETACSDLVDNDADGAVDCDDLDCALDLAACP